MIQNMPFLGIHQILSNPKIYSSMRSILGGSKSSEILVRDYIQPKTGDKILDIGCGPGDILEDLPLAIEYWGFDPNEEYIIAARKRFLNRGQFFCKKVSRNAIPGEKIFDIIIACGVFHHLTDDEADDMFELANTLLKPGGRFISFDGVYTRDQSYFAHLLLSNDRGSYVRTEEQYRKIAQKYFAELRVSIRSDLLRFPYTHIIIECIK
jgi:cyclopropane fatty-acyl-phospholipid synthase-like methyltransferase